MFLFKTANDSNWGILKFCDKKRLFQMKSNNLCIPVTDNTSILYNPGQSKLDETEKLWYLVLLNFWSLLPEVQFYVSANSKIFLFPNFLKSWVSAVSRVHRTDSELICYVLQKFSMAFLIMVENFIIPCKNWQLHFLIFIWSLSRYFADDFISRSSVVAWNILTTKSSSSESMASPQFRDAFCFSCFWNSKM